MFRPVLNRVLFSLLLCYGSSLYSLYAQIYVKHNGANMNATHDLEQKKCCCSFVQSSFTLQVTAVITLCSNLYKAQ